VFRSTGSEEVAVERVGEPVVGDRGGRRPQSLGGDLAAEQCDPRRVGCHVAAPEEVAVELLEVEQLGHPPDRVEASVVPHGRNRTAVP
jgi:hypothetical protein